MEGKSEACAHFSPMGEIAAAMCDLWCNESAGVFHPANHGLDEGL